MIERKYPTGVYKHDKKSKILWIRYGYRGKKYFESAKTSSVKAAVRFRVQRLAKLRGRGISEQDAERVTFEDLCQMIRDDYRVHNRKTERRLDEAIQHLVSTFGLNRAVDITTDRITAYIRQRQDEKAAFATIHAETAALKRMFNLAIQARKLHEKPYIPTPKVDNVRQGFFEEEEFRSMLSHLPAEVKSVAEFGYLTGWRVGEILRLQWRQVDFEAGVVRLDVGSTKNKEGRIFPFSAHPDLATLMRWQRKRVSAIEWAKQKSIPWVFTWGDGRPILDFRGSWKAACKNAGCSMRIFHDLRRTAVRNLERAGVPRSVAMKLTGHKTESIYRRYAIASESDLANGVKKLAAFQEQSKAVTQ